MEVNIKDLEFIQLSVNTALMPFHCVDDDLNNFLVEDAKNYLNDMMAVTYLFVDNGRQQIAAYFSLLNDKVAYDPQSKGVWNRNNRNHFFFIRYGDCHGGHNISTSQT